MSRSIDTGQGEVRHPAVYLRVSTDEQAKSGLGLGDQRHRTFAMATAKGWPEPEVYADEGISGTKDVGDRDGLKQLMADVEAKKIDAVIVLDLSRLGRKTVMVLQLVEKLRTHKVSLISCKESLDTTTAQGQFVLALFAALAQLERDMISERTKGALNQLARDGKDRGGRIPFGYLRDEKVIRIDPEAARHVRLIFSLREDGLTLQAIADYLNGIGIDAPYYGKQWYASTVREILMNEPAYCGGSSRGQEHLTWPVILEVVA
jgi:site-specific DNA recombinase